MIELKNSRTTYLGRASGRDKYSLDAFIGAVQMKEPGGDWQDIRPELVRDTDGWHIRGAPYYAEIKDDGTRLFCPDKNERNQFLRLPAPALFYGLGKNVVTNPAKLDGILVPNQITIPADWGEFRTIFSNTGMHFEVLFSEAPPASVFGKDSPRILLDAEAEGYDIGQLLNAVSGTGIPRPRLVAVNPEAIIGENQERWLDWSYKNGQLELGFDFGELEFPVLLKNTTIDEQVGASADDVWVCTGTDGYSSSHVRLYGGQHNYSSTLYVGSAFKFDSISITQGATIDTAYLQFRAYQSRSETTVRTYIDGEDVDSATQIASKTDWESRARTTAKIAWDGIGAWTADNWYDSPEIKTVIQEIVNRAGWTSGNALQVFWSDYEDQRSDTNARRIAHSYDSASSSAPKIHIEYTAGGATEKTSAETGAGADNSALLADMAREESGGGVDSRLSFLAGLTGADSGAGTEQGLLSLLLSSADYGGGTEAAATLLAGIIKADSGSGYESILDRELSLFDSGYGVDALSGLVAAILASEAGSGIDQSTLTSIVAKLSAETGSGADAAVIIAGLISNETGLGVDAGMIVGLKQLFSNDAGTSGDVLKALINISGSGSDMKLPGRQGRVGMPSKGVSL